jgi:hypothetical protein
MKAEHLDYWQNCGTAVAWKLPAHAQEFTYYGRNGRGTCEGAKVTIYGDQISLEPINSKGDVARCRIDMPTAEFLALADKARAASGKEA